ncbi:MAG: MFS transporter [Candidatus Neomarinimicrobiota bacterium]
MFTRESKTILFVTGLSHFAIHYSMLVFPAVRLVLREEFGAELDILGWVGGLAGFMFGLGAIPAGWLESKLGGRSLLLICQCGMALAGLTAFLAQNLLQLTVALFLLGLSASIYHPAGLTLISKRIRKMSRALGYHGIAGSMGLAAGWVVAAWLATHFSWRIAYGLVVLFFSVLAVITTMLVPSRRRSAPEIEATSPTETRLHPLVVYYVIVILVGLSFYGLNYLPVHFSEHSGGILRNIDGVFRSGLLTTFVFVAGVVGQIVGGRMGDKYDRTKLLTLILFLNVPFLVTISYATGSWLLVSAICLGVTHFALQPVGNSLIAEFTRSPSRGLGYGVSFFLSFGAGSLAEPIGGFLAVHYGVEKLFLLLAVALTAALFLSIYLRRISSSDPVRNRVLRQ